MSRYINIDRKQTLTQCDEADTPTLFKKSMEQSEQSIQQRDSFIELLKQFHRPSKFEIRGIWDDNYKKQVSHFSFLRETKSGLSKVSSCKSNLVCLKRGYLNKNQSEKMHRISFPKINNSPIPVDYSEIDTDIQGDHQQEDPYELLHVSNLGTGKKKLNLFMNRCESLRKEVKLLEGEIDKSRDSLVMIQDLIKKQRKIAFLRRQVQDRLQQQRK